MECVNQTVHPCSYFKAVRNMFRNNFEVEISSLAVLNTNRVATVSDILFLYRILCMILPDFQND